jgi:hypothetical protein
MTVHHVEMNDARAPTLDRRDLLRQMRKVSGKDRGCDFDSPGTYYSLSGLF